MELFHNGQAAVQKAVSSSNLNRKIDKRLDIVSEIFAGAMGTRWKETSRSMFCKKLFFEGFRYVKDLKLRYRYENRFVSISYNLEMSTEIPTDAKFSEIGDCLFQVQTMGKLSTKDAKWICKEFGGTTEERNHCLQRLDNKLIIDRIVALDLHRITVGHKKNSGKWLIRCESMIGSSTWILIPPIVNLIKPKPDECVQVMELFELVSDAVANNMPKESADFGGMP